MKLKLEKENCENKKLKKNIVKNNKIEFFLFFDL